MQKYFAAFLALTFLAPVSRALAHDEHTSEWNYIDERWPTHVGPLMDEWEPDAYLRRLLTDESKPINGWHGRDGKPAFDSISACGLEFNGHIQQRPRGTYFILVVRATDGKDHKLKWIPVEYRLDNQAPKYFTRRDGSLENRKVPDKFYGDDEQQDYVPHPGRPDIRDSRVLRDPLRYLFDNNSPTRMLQKAGGAEIKAKFKYLEAVKFPAPKELTQHERLQIYLPWVDDCTTKPDLWFQKDFSKETVWDDHLRAWVSVGNQYMVPFHENGWNTVRPTPSFYARFAYLWWEHHGFTAELHVAPVRGVSADSTIVGFLGRVSYGYGIWMGKYLTLSPEFGFRSMFGVQGFNLPGLGGGLNLAWEVPGTRHQNTGQRLVLEGGCDFEKHWGYTFIGNADMRGSWGNCKFGFGLGW